MANTIANVLVGVATLKIRQPNDALAEWSTTQQYVGDYSAKLYKSGSGNAGSTHVQIIPPSGITMTAWTAGIAAGYYHFYHYSSAVTGNFAQFEFRFEDPNTDAWVEITCVSLQTHTGAAAWVQELLLDGDACGYGGIGETGTSFSDWVLTTNDTAESDILAEGVVTDPADWILERVRVELWESSPERTTYIDSVTVNNVTYAIEPGDTSTPAITLSSADTEIGYTEDGVTFEYTAETTDIEVEEETFAIDSVITKESIKVTCNMAESSLYNMDKAMAGSSLSGSIMTFGGGTMKTMNLRIEGTNPAGYIRNIEIPKATATGAVGMSYKKGEMTVVPVTFQALKTADSDACKITDNAA